MLELLLDLLLLLPMLWVLAVYIMSRRHHLGGARDVDLIRLGRLLRGGLATVVIWPAVVALHGYCSLSCSDLRKLAEKQKPRLSAMVVVRGGS